MNTVSMESTTFITVLLVLLVPAVFYGMYVNVIKKRNKVLEAQSGIDVQLRKRYDLIPNILTIASKFMDHERSLLEEITKLRTEAQRLMDSSDTVSKINLDDSIKEKMGQIMVAVENYPDLKSDETMVQAMQTYNEVEEHIAAARRFYNSAAQELKNTVEIFPSSVIASMLQIKAVPFIQSSDVERKPINASDYLK